ncbi:MAG: hypothetical protein IT462_15220 [Planctomycetes bacterium]|nr:hypothetical protein [Planctomycetota bacterium]
MVISEVETPRPVTRTMAGGLAAKPAPRLGELLARLEGLSKVQEDRTVPSGDLSMNIDGTLRVGHHESFPVRDHALGQVAAKLRIPASYLRRCDPALRAQNVNRWLGDLRGDVLLRFEAGEVRAVLSRAYAPISHNDILGWLRKRLHDETQVRYELNDAYLDLQVVKGTPVEGIADIDRDPLHRGLHLRNSEIGMAKVTISALVYRTICLNGLLLGHGKWAYQRRHVGTNQVAENVRAAFEKALDLSAQAVGKFAGTRGVVIAEPLKALARVAERYELTESEALATRHAYSIEPAESLYGVINAVTRAANSSSLSVDSRHKLQTLGGRLVELARTGRRWLD